ncbi:MAG: S53 family serine peptidase [Candidatus Eremiobacteraeota bacterium]|nr:S53 family serine peptidase [Candidatus Eremiobacteraeota bacterium]
MRVSHITPVIALTMFTLGATICSAASTPGIVAGVSRDRSLRDLGPAAATTRMGVGVMLAYRNRAELEQLVEEQSTSQSRQFRRFLTRQQFNQRYAPSSTDYQRTIASLQSAGFSITRTYHNRTFIDASAPLWAVQRYFHTEIHLVAQPGHGVRFANVRPATAPPELRGVITGVAGLDNLVRFHTFNHVASGINRPARAVTSSSSAAVLSPLFGPDFGYGPRALIGAYGLRTGSSLALGGGKATGTGQVAAIVVDADFLDSDLSSYLKYFRVNRTGRTVRVLIDGGPPSGVKNPGSIETTLDVETLASLAPAASLYVYEFPSFTNFSNETQYILDAYEQAVDDAIAGTVNSSFGACEEKFGLSSFPQMSDEIALQGAALGMTFHAASGDAGSVGTGCSSTSVMSPASNPHFIAVGGTSLYEDPLSGALLHEFAWAGSGGGLSAIYPVPSYQQGLSHVLLSGRNLPDVSFDGDPNTGVSFYYSGFPSGTGFIGPLGGTSLSSPIFGAGLTLANQIAGSRAGFVNPSLYRTFRSYGYHGLVVTGGSPLFRDVTFGYNGFYNAGPGYDQVTGIGAMEFANLARFIR